MQLMNCYGRQEIIFDRVQWRRAVCGEVIGDAGLA